MNFIKKIKRYFINRKLKKINEAIIITSDIKSYLVLENQRLDLITEYNKMGKKNDK